MHSFKPQTSGMRCISGYWAVVQSSLGLSGEEIWQHLASCMDARGRSGTPSTAAAGAGKSRDAAGVKAGADEGAAASPRDDAGGAGPTPAPGRRRQLRTGHAAADAVRREQA